MEAIKIFSQIRNYTNNKLSVMATKIIGVYQITYINGNIQTKNLISHDDYVNIYKAYQDKIFELEKENKFKETNSSRNLKKELKDMFGPEFFTTMSPLFEAISTNVLTLLPQQGGSQKCNVRKIN